MRTLVQALEDRTVGTVEQVSTDMISVLLDPEAPYATALNAGSPEGFPRINGYLLIPSEAGATIGWINSVQVERLPYPKRKGMQDFGLVDLPFPCRLVGLVPIGTLVHHSGVSQGELAIEVRRGVDLFPSVGDPVVMPTRQQLRAIVEGESSTTRRVHIGRCPTAAGADVHVDPDKLFGRHLAVLGNTGSGKSCSVAGLIRWSIEAADRERSRHGRTGRANARFIILDPNGEYAHAFAGEKNVRLFQVRLESDGDGQCLEVPAWLWNGEEWAAFTGAAPGVQKPVLFEALRRLRSGLHSPDQFETRVRQSVHNYLAMLNDLVSTGGFHGWRGRENCADVLLNVNKTFDGLAKNDCCVNESLRIPLMTIADAASRLELEVRGNKRTDRAGYYHSDFAQIDIEERILSPLRDLARTMGIPDDEPVLNEDIPVYFAVDELGDCVSALAAASTVRDLAQFVDSLKLRIRVLLNREGLASIANPPDCESVTLDGWLSHHIGANDASNGQIAIIDLSLVPSEVIRIVVAVITRLVFEALQWYRRIEGKELPTVLVLEEAHSFVHEDLVSDGASNAGRMCCQVFERVAREGRKFGLGLVLSSQRPSELSQTVLSQCNSFLLHRIVNDRDQELVRRLVPDGLAGSLRGLPSLPSRRAILLGWAAPAPILVEINELSESQRPHSPDPAFWDVWTGDPERGKRCIDWGLVAHRWVGHLGCEYDHACDTQPADGAEAETQTCYLDPPS